VLVSDGSLINRRELVLEEVRARAAVWCELDGGPKTDKAETDEDAPRATSVAIGTVKRILLIRFLFTLLELSDGYRRIRRRNK
jgi:hypothetical protein